MKIFSSIIPNYEIDSVFKPIRSKTDYIKLLLISMKLLLINVGEVKGNNPVLKVIIDKMSRIFFYQDGKYFSVSFPFVVEDENDVVKLFMTYSGKEINNKVISEINYILSSGQFLNNRSLIDFYIEPYDISFDSIYLLEELLMIEPAYIRYDCDPDNEKGKLHPLYHLDLHYSQYSTFKIGLFDKIEGDFFEDIHNVKTDCVFIEH